jgi:hypothetical protein
MWGVSEGGCVLCEQKNATVSVGEDKSESKEGEHQTATDKDPNNHKREPPNNVGAAKGDVAKGDATSVGGDGGVGKVKGAPLEVNPAAAAAAQVSGAALEKKEVNESGGHESGGHKQADLEPGTSQQTHLSSIYPSSVSLTHSLSHAHTDTMVWRHELGMVSNTRYDLKHVCDFFVQEGRI